ncbi:MAG: hypothetical protein K9N51_10195, partial [Candidatus Pacebacteria bacterium]|nr:hypothetical protein [Candidatus Paceibacterota bacterium]
EYVQLLIDYAGGKTATLNLYCGTNTPYAATVTTGEETTFVTVDTGALFKNATGAMLELFKTGKPNVDRQETLAIMKLRDKALNE